MTTPESGSHATVAVVAGAELGAGILVGWLFGTGYWIGGVIILVLSVWLLVETVRAALAYDRRAP